MKYVYTVWFRDPSFSPEDPDREWPACFVIDAATEPSAKDWGDHLARRYAGEHSQDIIDSTTEALDTSTLPGIDALPVVAQGHDATDDEIGW